MPGEFKFRAFNAIEEFHIRVMVRLKAHAHEPPNAITRIDADDVADRLYLCFIPSRLRIMGLPVDCNWDLWIFAGEAVWHDGCKYARQLHDTGEFDIGLVFVPSYMMTCERRAEVVEKLRAEVVSAKINAALVKEQIEETLADCYGPRLCLVTWAIQALRIVRSEDTCFSADGNRFLEEA